WPARSWRSPTTSAWSGSTSAASAWARQWPARWPAAAPARATGRTLPPPGPVDRLILHTPLLAPALVRRRFHLQVAAMTTPGLFPAVVWLSRRRLVSDLYKRLLVEGAGVGTHCAEVHVR